jgi:hypothetical protein
MDMDANPPMTRRELIFCSLFIEYDTEIDAPALYVINIPLQDLLLFGFITETCKATLPGLLTTTSDGLMIGICAANKKHYERGRHSNVINIGGTLHAGGD